MCKITTSLIREAALQRGETLTTSIKNVEKKQQQQQLLAISIRNIQSSNNKF